MHNAYGYIAFGMCLRSVFYAFVACSELCENAKWWKRFEKSRAKRKILHRDIVFYGENGCKYLKKLSECSIIKESSE